MGKFIFSAGLESGSEPLHVIVSRWVTEMAAGETEKCHSVFDETMKNTLTLETLPLLWEQLTGGSGAFVSVSKITAQKQGVYTVCAVSVEFENAYVSLTIACNKENRIAGINYSGKQFKQNSFPENTAVTEQEVTIDAGEGCPLPGIITRGVNISGKTPAAVIVHGSGPVDIDLTLGANKVYRQLSEALAERGITVLRYQKRTNKYGAKSAPDPARLTVAEETVNDAVAAFKLLQSQDGVDPERVFIIGHSLGGMLAPKIAAICGEGVAGLVVMAGSPRKLWEIVRDQNQPGLEQLKALDKGRYEESLEMINKYLEAAKTLRDMDDETALATVVFGMPAWYLRDLESVDAAELLRNSSIPAYITQGSEDFQVYTAKDFEGWRTALTGRDNTTFKLYSGLNHMFMKSPADSPVKNTLSEYEIPAVIDVEFVNDIANWMKTVKTD